MNIRKAADFIKENFFFYLIGCLIILGMKYFYSKAGSDDLRWILAPTAKWVEILSGIPFEYEQGAGYVNHELRMLIAPSCSGIQFMIITTAMLIFSFTHKLCNGFFQNGMIRKGRGFCWIIASVLLSYLLTIFINGLRIIVAVYLPLSLTGTKLCDRFLTAERLHTLIGTVVYFIALMTIYQLAGYFFQKKENRNPHKALGQVVRKCAPPAFWYFAIVLGLPFLNRAYQKNGGKFLEFAALVAVCCMAVLLLYCLVFLTVKFLQSKMRS